MSIKAQDLYSAFEAVFGEKATAAGLIRARGKALKWKCASPDRTTLSVGFRLNRKNSPGYPGEFMPDIAWSGRRGSDRDSGEVSFYQYTLPSENESVAALRRSVVDGFIAQMHLDGQRQDPRSLVALLAAGCEFPIVPHQNCWLPYWNADDAKAWGGLFGAAIGGWVSRFLAAPETLDSYCRRVIWTKRS